MHTARHPATADWDIASRLERLSLLARLSEHRVMSDRAYARRRANIILASNTRGLLRIALNVSNVGLLIALALLSTAVVSHATLPDAGSLAIVLAPMLAVVCVCQCIDWDVESIDAFEARHRVLSTPELHALYADVTATSDFALLDAYDNLVKQNYMLRVFDQDLVGAALQLYRAHDDAVVHRQFVSHMDTIDAPLDIA